MIWKFFRGSGKGYFSVLSTDNFHLIKTIWTEAYARTACALRWTKYLCACVCFPYSVCHFRAYGILVKSTNGIGNFLLSPSFRSIFMGWNNSRALAMHGIVEILLWRMQGIILSGQQILYVAISFAGKLCGCFVLILPSLMNGLHNFVSNEIGQSWCYLGPTPTTKATTTTTSTTQATAESAAECTQITSYFKMNA